MATDSQFIHKKAVISTPPPPPERNSSALPGSLQNISLEIARQRALKAAEYYHKTVLATSDAVTPSGKDVDSSATVIDSSEMADPLRVGVTPASEDSFYRAKLREGFIDLRNSYNEKSARFNQHRPRTNTQPSNHDKPSSSSSRNRNKTGGSDDVRPSRSANGMATSRPKVPSRSNKTSPSHKLNDKYNLYRSNSSLDIDHVEFLESVQMSAVHREYGSTNSLDIMSTSGDSFFAMLQDYRNENFDQRAPAPPEMKQVLRGKVEYPVVSTSASITPASTPMAKSSAHHQFATPSYLNLNPNKTTTNGELVSPSVFPVTPEKDSCDGSVSPRPKSKHSQKNKDRKARAKTMATDTTAGIFRKLRGTKSDPNEAAVKAAENPAEPDGKSEERLRRKAFVHYDCQSIGVMLTDVSKKRNSSGARKNTTTGASAASSARGTNPTSDSVEDTQADETADEGDGKSNDMVLSCSFFRNEVGGEEERTVSLTRHTAQKRMQQILGTKHMDVSAMIRQPLCNGVSILDVSQSPLGHSDPAVVRFNGHIIEHVDLGAFYYRNYFKDFDHQNYFGVDENIGPVAISIKREKVEEREISNGKKENGTSTTSTLFQYRIIVRTAELSALRGCIVEDSIPSSSRLSSSRGLPPKDILEYACPDIPLACLRQAVSGPKTAEQLMKLDEQRITKKYKFGIMYCKAGQSTEEQMYNNEHASPAFEEFLDGIGQHVRLKGFEKYRGGLDCKTDSTGTHSLYTSINDYEIMFHVSTMLPFTPNNKQQLLRKRHIGNDIVTIVFQEPGALPFTPKTVRSHFQHVFIIVKVHNPNTDNTYYSIAVSRSRDVPSFGPPIPEGAMFPKSKEFVDMLLTKAINAENAAHKSDKFTVMAIRTREEYLKDLATNYVSTTSLDSGSKLSKFSLGSGRKKERIKSRPIPDIYANGAVVWSVQVDDFCQSTQVDCHLGIGMEMLVVMEDESKDVIFAVPCRSIIGYTALSDSLRVYYEHGECIVFTMTADTEDVQEVAARLGMLSQACQTQEMTLRRNGLGQLGFHVHYEGIVSEVESYGFAWQAGLRKNSRLVEICKVATATLSHDQMIDLLRTSVTVKVVVIPPQDNGQPRRGMEDLGSSRHSLNSHNTSASSGDHLSLDDDHSNASSQSTVVKGYPIVRIVPSTEPKKSHQHASNYTDIRAININLEDRFDQSLGLPSSQDGMSHSRQSSGRGSSDGHPLEGQRTSEGYGSGSRPGSEDRHSRHSSHDSSEASDGKLWLTRSSQHNTPRDTHHIGSYHGSTGQWFDQDKMRTPISSHSAFVPVIRSHDFTSHMSVPKSDKRSYTTKSSPTIHHSDHAFNEQPSTSSSNVSDLSLSSNSSHLSVTSNRHHTNSADDQGRIHRASSLSPSGRRKQEAFTAQHRGYLDVSPLYSANTSPQPSKKILSGTSEESLTTRNLRQTPRSTPAGKEAQHSTFQDDLMRLINPDISEAELAQFQKENSRKKLHASAPRLQRTFSDESLYGGNMKAERAAYLDAIGSDVIFTTAVPAQVVNTTPPTSSSANYLNVADKLSLQVSRETSNSEARVSQTPKTSSRVAKNTLIPLPNTESNLEWSNLVDAAKTFEDMKQSSGAVTNSDHEYVDGKSHSSKSSKNADGRRPVAAHERHIASARHCHANSAWQSSGNDRIQELENKCRYLQQEVEKERSDRLNLETEVQHLRQENLRLQEESHTAAAQLRKFTEWFFNTIDKQ